MASIYEFHLQNSQEFIPLVNGFTVGRVQASLTLNDPMVSRRHGFFEISGNKLYYTDETKTNPTLLNGQTLATGDRTELRMGDTLQFGSTVVTVKMSLAQGHGTAPMTQAAVTPKVNHANAPAKVSPLKIAAEPLQEAADALAEDRPRKSKRMGIDSPIKLPTKIGKEHIPFLLIGAALLLVVLVLMI